MDEHPIINTLSKMGVVPVVTIENPADAVDLALALVQGGLPCAEITFRTAGAATAIQRIAANSNDILLGAGSIWQVSQAKEAVEAGAHFLVSAGLSPDVIQWCNNENVPIFPGVATATEIIKAMTLGLQFVKFFPAEAMGGIETLKSLSAPFPYLKFMPTGGVNMQNLANYLTLDAVFACGGSWMVNKSLLNTRKFHHITQLVQETVNHSQAILGERKKRF